MSVAKEVQELFAKALAYDQTSAISVYGTHSITFVSGPSINKLIN